MAVITVRLARICRMHRSFPALVCILVGMTILGLLSTTFFSNVSYDVQSISKNKHSFTEPQNSSQTASVTFAIHLNQKQLTPMDVSDQSGGEDHIALLLPSQRAHTYDTYKMIRNSVTWYDVTEQDAKIAREVHLLCSISQARRNGGNTDLFIRNQSSNDLVPNVAFYVIFGNISFTFIHHLSVLSAYKNMRARHIYVVGDKEPEGTWWEKTRNDVPVLDHIFWKRPTTIYGNNITRDVFASDVVRHQILMRGIYLDTDILMLKSVEPLRGYDVTMGLLNVHENVDLGNGFIMAKPGAEFLNLWYRTYTTFDSTKNHFSKHSMKIPHQLYHLYPDLVHVEKDTIYTPSYYTHDKDLLFNGKYDWRRNYAIHVWREHKYHIPEGPQDIVNLNSTLGEISRLILYGN